MNQSTLQLSMLAIDDEVSIQLVLQHYFKDVFSVITKGNGKEALAWMQEGNIPDIIVADLNMPEMDGYTFIYHVRSSGFLKNIPMVMLSDSSDSTDNKIRCLESGADNFMVRHLNPRKLSARMNGILRPNGKINL